MSNFAKLHYGRLSKANRFWLDTVSRAGSDMDTIKGTPTRGHGRMFATKRAFREYMSRSLFGDWETRGPRTASPRIAAQGVRIDVNVPSDGHLLGLTRRSDDPGNDTRVIKRPSTSVQGHDPFVQVRPIGGIWRRYNVANNVRVWLSDHANMGDALANTGALVDELAKLDRSNTIVQRVDQ